MEPFLFCLRPVQLSTIIPHAESKEIDQTQGTHTQATFKVQRVCGCCNSSLQLSLLMLQRAVQFAWLPLLRTGAGRDPAQVKRDLQ